MNSEDQKVLVTGGAGFIGSHMTESLVNRGNKVVVFDNFSNGIKRNLEDINCEIITGDLRNKDDVENVVKDVGVVYHFAADLATRASTINPFFNFENNVIGTLNILEACRHNDIRKIVYPSSSYVYGITSTTPVDETTQVAPIENYGATKCACEAYMHSYSNLYGLNVTIMRLSQTIGSKRNRGNIFDFYSKLIKNSKILPIFGDGKQKRTYVHVKDSVDAILFATENSRNRFEIFNVATDPPYTVKDIASFVIELLGFYNVEFKFEIPNPPVKDDVIVNILSSKKLMSLGWKPKFTIKDAVSDSLKWLMKTS